MRCPVVLPAMVASPPVVLRQAADWYATVSGGAIRLAFDVVPVEADDPMWSQLSGWRWPGGAEQARDAAQQLVAGLAYRQRASGAGWPAVLVLAPGDRIHPHTWRFRNGGVHLGGRRWCRRYTLVATDVPLAALVHELGHLLFEWPDLAATGMGADCIMATGALAGDGRPPPWPCAPLRVQAGWVAPRPVRAATPVCDLPHGEIGIFDGLLIERRDDRVLAYSTDPLRLERRTDAVDPSRPVLAVLADVPRSAGRLGGGSSVASTMDTMFGVGRRQDVARPTAPADARPATAQVAP